MNASQGYSSESGRKGHPMEADNSKSYWMANKALYDQAVHAPMAALLKLVPWTNALL